MSSISRLPVHALLLLGRLDGRLQHSPARDIWMARARLSGAATLAGLAGLPITVSDLQNWIAGRTPPPRHSEGLNDPLSVAALFHFALSATEAASDPIAQATLTLVRSLLDDRAEAQSWARDDLVHFGPAWREAGALLNAPYPAPDLVCLAERLLEAQRLIGRAAQAARMVTTIDGRELQLAPSRFDTIWMLASFVPSALQAAGLALRPLPSMVGLPKFLDQDAAALARQLERMIGQCAARELQHLQKLEARLARLPVEMAVTKRSKAPLLVRLELAYPGLRVAAVARLLGISHQGATKLSRQVQSHLQTQSLPSSAATAFNHRPA